MGGEWGCDGGGGGGRLGCVINEVFPETEAEAEVGAHDSPPSTGVGGGDEFFGAIGVERGARKSAVSGDAAAEAAAEVSVVGGGRTPFYLSRTFWVNAVALVALLFPEVRVWLEENPVEFTTALGAVNVLLRFISVGKYSVSTASSLDPQTGRGQGCDKCTSSIGDSALGFVLFLGVGGLMWGCCADSGGDMAVSVSDGKVEVSRGETTRSLLFDKADGVLSFRQSCAVSECEPVVVEVAK